MPETFNPPVGFYFQVDFAGAPPGNATNSFQEAVGLSLELGIDEVVEGSENRFKYKLPKQAKYVNLVLKRGMIKTDSDLAKWILNVMQLGQASPIETKNIVVTLLDTEGKPTMQWKFYNAWPVKLDTSFLEADNTELLVEVLEFSFTYFEVETNTLNS